MQLSPRIRPTFAALVVALVALPAIAAEGERPRPPSPGPHPGDQVGFCGKVVPLVEAGCIGIVGITTTVELSSVTPRPEIGSTIEGTGIIGGGVSKCMQGVHLQTATYSKAQYCSPGP